MKFRKYNKKRNLVKKNYPSRRRRTVSKNSRAVLAKKLKVIRLNLEKTQSLQKFVSRRLLI
jgi:hypothetical protein